MGHHSKDNHANHWDLKTLQHITTQYGTPVWVYDAQVIQQQIEKLRQFDVIRFAQKACSNLHVLRLMRQRGVKVDAVSLGEIQRALAAGYQPGFSGSEIIFTADLFDEATLDCVIKQQITVNIGSLDMLDQLGMRAPGHAVWLRINPGFGHGHSKKTNTGGENSKHGIWFSDLPQAIRQLQQYNLVLVGIHMHIGSGVDYAHLSRVCQAMVQQVAHLQHDIQSISAGGGLAIPYKNGEQSIDTQHYYQLWDQARQDIAAQVKHPVSLEIEPGRFLVAQAGCLITEVRAVKQMGRRHFALVDAGFNDLMRPALYGSYHHISLLTPRDPLVPPKDWQETVVAGPLCEAGDVFTQQADGTVVTQLLPPLTVGDYLLLHDTGAYGASMSSNYNSRPLLPEVLIDNNTVRLIRRRQTIDDLLNLEQETHLFP